MKRARALDPERASRLAKENYDAEPSSQIRNNLLTD